MYQNILVLQVSSKSRTIFVKNHSFSKRNGEGGEDREPTNTQRQTHARIKVWGLGGGCLEGFGGGGGGERRRGRREGVELIAHEFHQSR